MHLHCTGEKQRPEDPLLLFFHGFGGQALDAVRYRDNLDDKMRFCAFDRQGYGWSERGEKPRTSTQFAFETHELLRLAGEDTERLLLVGHSFAGFNMRVFR